MIYWGLGQQAVSSIGSFHCAAHYSKSASYHLFKHKFHQVFDALFRVLLCWMLQVVGGTRGEVGGARDEY